MAGKRAVITGELNVSQKSAQELQQMIEKLESRVAKLEAQVATLQRTASRAIQAAANRSGVRTR